MGKTVELWHELVKASGRELLPRQVEQLDRFIDLLRLANERMNLTRIVDREQAGMAHVADSLTLLPHIPAGTKRLADVGSGGGVPGLVLAAVLPETSVVLVEATQKKAVFLAETAKSLGLANVEVRPQRAEDVGRSELRDSCDVVTARAVGELVMLVEWCLPLVRKGGKLLAMKGGKAAEELAASGKAIHVLSGGEPRVHPAPLPGAEQHVIIEIPKLGTTDARYPRAASVAKGRAIR